ncbi:MAG: hypothetical protein HZB39_05945 [Planctomycetes bacterium]|nr:hypothetical protein [Planctomycetota bacterium]
MQVLLALASALVAAAAPQDSTVHTRRAGVARLADGKPWSRATVIAREREIPYAAEVDEVRASTDDAGRFALDLLEGREYAVWCEAPAGDGRALVSSEVVLAPSLGRIDLTAEPGPRGAQRIKLEGFPQELLATARATLRESLISRVTVVVVRDGALVLPPRPAGAATLDLIAADGRPLLFTELPDANGDHVLGASAPRSVRVRVAAIEGDRPFPASRLVCLRAGVMFDLAHTDDQGLAVLDLAFGFPSIDGVQPDWNGFPENLAAIVPGRQLGLVSCDEAPLRDAAQLAADEDVHASCRPPESQCRLRRVRLLAGGKPLRGVLASVVVTAWHESEADALVGVGSALAMRTDAEGTLDVAGLRDADDGVSLQVDQALRAAVPAGWLDGVAAWLPLPLPAASDAEEVTIDVIRDLRRVEFSVLAAADRAPVEGATLMLGNPDGHDDGASLTTDRLGRVRTLLPRRLDAPLAAGVLDARGWRFVALDAGCLNGDDAKAAVIELPLHSTSRLRIVPHLAAGVVRNVPFAVSVGTGHLPPVGEGGDVVSVEDGVRNGRTIFRELGPGAAQCFASRFAIGGTSHDADLIVHLPAIPGTWTISVSAMQDDALWSTWTEYRNEGRVDLETFEVELVRR